MDRLGPQANKSCDNQSHSHSYYTQATSGRLVNIYLSAILSLALYVNRFAGVDSLRNRYGAFTVISAKPCQNALGQVGTCMFMWDCIKSEGIHLGTCSDRFLFGSCCHHNISTTPTTTTAPQATPSLITAIDRATSNPQSNVETLQESNQVYQFSMIASSTTTTPIPVTSMPTRIFLQSTSTLSQQSDEPKLSMQQVAHQLYPNILIPSSNHSDFHSSNRPSDDTVHAFVADPRLNSTSSSDGWQSITPPTVAYSETSTASTTQPPIITTSGPATTLSADISAVYSYQNSSVPLMSSVPSPTPAAPQEDSQSVQTTSIPQLQQPHQTSPEMIAYQPVMASRPPLHPVSSASYAPGAPASQVNQQTQKPHTNSWLSRPGLMAIFHSFKPYLNPNRQRPTYRPYVQSSYRPQHQRPFGFAHQRPAAVIGQLNGVGGSQHQTGAVAAQQQSNESSASLNESKISTSHIMSNLAGLSHSSNSSSSLMISTTTPSSVPPVTQLDNNDHHIVNPSSTMTDRQRPIDKNQINSAADSVGLSQQQTPAEFSSATSNFSGQNSTIPGYASAHSFANDHINFMNYSSPSIDDQSSTNVPSNVMINALPLSESKPTFLGHLSAYNSASVSQRPSLVISETDLVSHPNQTNSLPSYPLISSFSSGLNTVDSSTSDLSTMSSIDEIHGLSVSNNSPSNITDSSTIYSTVANNYSLHRPTLGDYQQTSQELYTTSPNMNSTSTSYSSISPMTQPSHQPTTTGYLMTALSSSPFTTTHLQHQTAGAALVANVDDHHQLGGQTIVTVSNEQLSSNYTTVRPLSNTVGLGPTSTPPSFTSTVSTGLTAPSYTRPTQETASVLTSNSMKNGQQQGGTDTQLSKEVACGVTALYPQTKVVGGKNAAFGAWPWQVSVRKVSFFGFSSTHRCGGAVISSEWIATAGHCVEDLALQSIRIRVGEYDFSSMGEPYPHIERAARRKVVHPKYNFYTYENDLALVQLDQPLQFPPHVAPICLPPDNIDLLGRNATVTGWGRLNEGGTLPTILQEVRVPIVSNDKCKDMFLNAGRPEYIPDIFLCAGYEEGGRDSCQGDSGGPLQVRGDDGKWFLAGIISWGIGCAEQNLPGVCTRISRFKLWIQSTINSTS